MKSGSMWKAEWLRCTVAVVMILVAGVSAASAQNLKDDIVNNDLEALKGKVALLEPNFKDFPYLAHYLKNTKRYDQQMVDYLISQGAGVDQVDEFGVGPLYYAIIADNLEAVSTLIAAKANVNVEWRKPKDMDWYYIDPLNYFDSKTASFTASSPSASSSTQRPLGFALYCGNTDIVPVLLKAGADPLGWIYRVKDERASTATAAASTPSWGIRRS